MARKSTISHQIICDRCGIKEDVEFDFSIPPDWGEISNRKKLGTSENVVCPDCYKSFLTWFKDGART